MPPLTDQQKDEACAVAAVGCDRRIAARYLGCTGEELAVAVAGDAEFARRLAQSEARAEVAHLSRVREAAQEDKNWRASVWWLERHDPERYGRRGPGALTTTEIRRFVEALASIITDEVADDATRRRLLSRLRRLAEDSSETAEQPAIDTETQGAE